MPHKSTGSIVVGPQGTRRIDPSLIDRQARGSSAAGELRDLGRGSAMANALRMSRAKMPGVRGQGAAAQGPSGWNALATVLEQRKGRGQLSAMEEQAGALRGEVAGGERAGLEYQEALASRDFDFKREQEAARTKREEEAIRGQGLYTDPEGNKKWRFQTRQGPVDENRDFASMEGLTPVETPKSKRPTRFQMPTKLQEEVTKTGDMFRTAQRILGSFKPEYARATLGGLEIPGLTKTINWAARSVPMLTDEPQEARADYWRDYKKYFELPEIKEGFGSQFTKGEMGRWDAASINENMDAKTLQKNIDTRLEILKEVSDRMRKSMKIRYDSPRAIEFIDYELSTDKRSGGDDKSDLADAPSKAKGLEKSTGREQPKPQENMMEKMKRESQLTPEQQQKQAGIDERLKVIRARKAELEKLLFTTESVSSPNASSSAGGF